MKMENARKIYILYIYLFIYLFRKIYYIAMCVVFYMLITMQIYCQEI